MDDDRLIRKTLRLILENAGYAVAEAPDGIEALEALRTSSQRMAVILDWRMPRLDGIGVLRTLAETPLLARHHAYLMLTVASDEFPSETIEALPGLDVSVMAKPFDMDKLLDAITEMSHRLETDDELINGATGGDASIQDKRQHQPSQG